MRPLRLELSAFGPYAGTEIVDFDALTELGLFVVAGTNGSGKTTIFDALHYSLYGSLPGRRVGYVRLRSDHADKRAECRVRLDFVAKGHRWRVERSPRQRRPKRRGDGYTEVEHRATLFRFEGENPVAVANRIGEVDEQCRNLVGLTGPQFERVALLPQGEFSRVLAQSSTERRELLRTLFSSEVFGDATRLLTEQAAYAVAGDRAALERLDAEQATIAAEIAELATECAPRSIETADVAAADHSPTDATGAAETGDAGDIATADHNATDPTDIAALHEALRCLRQGELVELQCELDRHTAAAAQTAHDLQIAVAGSDRFDRRLRVQAALEAHRGDQAQHDRDTARLMRARAAVPVAGQAQAAIQQGQRHVQAGRRVDELLEQLNRALGRAGLPMLTSTADAALAGSAQQAAGLGERLATRRDAAQRIGDLELAVTGLQRELRRRADHAATLAEQMRVAQARHRQAEAELESLARTPDVDGCTSEVRRRNHELEKRLALDGLESEHQRLVALESELVPTLESLQQKHDDAQRARIALARLQLEERLAVDALAECERRRRALDASSALRGRLARLRVDDDQARATADRCWDAFVTGTAPRIAATLVDDEPCPVCGSPDHPDPAQPTTGAGPVTQADVTAARAGAERVQAELRRVEREIELLFAADEDLAAVTAEQLAGELQAATAVALAARTASEAAQRAAADLDELDARLQATRHGLATTETERHAVADERNRCIGALAELADEPVETVRARASQAAQQLTAARDKAERVAQLQSLLAELDRTTETLGLEQITAENRRVSISDQVADRQRELDAARAALASLDAGLAGQVAGAAAPSPHDHEQRAGAVRQALDLLAQMTTAVALRADAADGLRRAESILRERLQQSPFDQVPEALDAAIDAEIMVQLEAQTAGFIATTDRLLGQLHEFDDVPAERPDVDTARTAADRARDTLALATRRTITLTNRLERLESSVVDLERRRTTLQGNDLETRRLERVAALVKGDNDRNTSLENWVLAAHLRDVVELANLRLAGSTRQRFQLCVLDDGENRRGRWGLDLGVEDTVTGTRRPTAGLSGGELFQASLALALGLADAVMNQSAGVHIDALFIDEGFGSLDENSIERAIDLLDELRDRGAMVGVITHVPALLEALPRGITVVTHPGGHGSTIRQVA